MRNFNLNEEIEIKNYLNNILYTGYYKVFNGIKTSLFDQKVCFDLLQADCKCILNFCENRHIDHFTMLDLFNDEFTQNLFRNKTFHNGKAVINSNTIREYNKVFLQIFESLSYTEILSKSRLGRTNVYTIRELAILRLLANSADACITFICLSAYKFIESSNLLNSWNTYINSPNRMNLHTFRDNYDSYMMTHTKHQADTHQIFQKIVNPLFYLYELTKYAPTKNSKFLLQSPNDLSYFRVHRRDQNIRQLGETRIQIAQRIRQNMMATDNILLNEEKQKNLVGK
jgi:hypothetical protein